MPTLTPAEIAALTQIRDSHRRSSEAERAAAHRHPMHTIASRQAAALASAHSLTADCIQRLLNTQETQP